MNKIIYLFLCCLLLVGCGSVNAYRFKSETAKALNGACEPEKVLIVNQTSYDWSYGWYAVCNNQMYWCAPTPNLVCTPSKGPKEIRDEY